MLIREALNWAVKELKDNSISEAESSAVLLLTRVIEKDREYVFSYGEKELSTGEEKKFKGYIKRRLEHEPVWYIVGEVDFYGRKFKVNNDVLTPRPETEFLVQEVLNSVSSIKYQVESIIEVGTGSGAIIISLAKDLCQNVIPDLIRNLEKKDSCFRRNDNGNSSRFARTIKFIATDISREALKVAKKNAKLHKVDKDIEFLQGDLLESLLVNCQPASRQGGLSTVNCIIANLPYIPHEDMDSLQFDVLHHEPRLALDGGKEGLELYERLLMQMKELDFSGMAFFEIGTNQGKLITKIIQNYFPKARIEVKKDLAGIDRIVIIKLL